ncbi:MAG: metal-dependent hydrolase [Candidatus Competibacter sp.]
MPPSKIGRLFWWVSVPLERRFGHRTITHSAVGLLAVALVASPLWLVQPLYFGCALGGYWSHLWIDMLNVRGVDLFWPSPGAAGDAGQPPLADGGRRQGGNGVALGAAALDRGAVSAQLDGLSRRAASGDPAASTSPTSSTSGKSERTGTTWSWSPRTT